MATGSGVGWLQYIANLACVAGITPREARECTLDELEAWARAARNKQKVEAQLMHSAFCAAWYGKEAVRVFIKETTLE